MRQIYKWLSTPCFLSTRNSLRNRHILANVDHFKWSLSSEIVQKLHLLSDRSDRIAYPENPLTHVWLTLLLHKIYHLLKEQECNAYPSDLTWHVVVRRSLNWLLFMQCIIHMGAERTFSSNIENFWREKGFGDFEQLSYFGLRCRLVYYQRRD